MKEAFQPIGRIKTKLVKPITERRDERVYQAALEQFRAAIQVRRMDLDGLKERAPEMIIYKDVPRPRAIYDKDDEVGSGWYIQAGWMTKFADDAYRLMLRTQEFITVRNMYKLSIKRVYSDYVDAVEFDGALNPTKIETGNRKSEVDFIQALERPIFPEDSSLDLSLRVIPKIDRSQQTDVIRRITEALPLQNS